MRLRLSGGAGGSDGSVAPASIAVRRADPADAPALSALCAEHAAFERLPFDPAGHVERLRAALEGEPPELFAWLAGSATGAIGYATAGMMYSTLEGASFLHMDCLFVRAGHRGRGTGGRLMEQVIALGRDLGCPKIEWQTPAWNEDAARFYLRSGAACLPKSRFCLALPRP